MVSSWVLPLSFVYTILVVLIAIFMILYKKSSLDSGALKRCLINVHFGVRISNALK